MPQPIQSASANGLFTGTLPDVSDALLSWFQPMTFNQVMKTIVNFQEVETLTTTSTQGVRQPMTPQQLMLKPEGQRAWRWETIHALPSLVLNVDDIIIFNTVQYRVMQKMNWTEYGYVEYHITQDYTP